MNYNDFKLVMNSYIFNEEKRNLLRKIAEYPERFVGLFRPTKPFAKILQNLLQSHEIRFGDAMEEIIRIFINEWGYESLTEIVFYEGNKRLSIDQYFTDGNIYYFIEQKVRDDHDSSKKRGQMDNFEKKLEMLTEEHGENIIGIMYFIDPELNKNKKYYMEKIKELSAFYGIKLYLFYGKELFDYFGHPHSWIILKKYLIKWKNEIPLLPELDFDKESEKSFNEIKDLEIRYWRKLLQNEKLWEGRIIHTLFSSGETLRKLVEYFDSVGIEVYRNVARLLREKISRYY